MNLPNNPIARDSVTPIPECDEIRVQAGHWSAVMRMPAVQVYPNEATGSRSPMKVVLAAHGTRGDVEPCATVGLELQRRGHDVRMAVPPDLVGFVESAGLAAVGYGPDSEEQVIAVADFVHRAFTPQNPVSLVRAGRELFVEGWAQMSRTLTSVADGADLLVTGQTYHGVVANIAEYYDIPCGDDPPLPHPRQRPARSSVDTVAGTVWSASTMGGLVAVLADDQGRRRCATP